MKNTMRKAMLSTIAMLVVAVMSLTGVTYAWFSASTTADVTGMTMTVAAAQGGFQVSDSATGPWSSTVDFKATGKALNPVSTVDAKNFFVADVLTETSPTEVSIQTKADTNSNYWDNTFYARNTSESDVYVYLSTGEIFKELEGKAEDGKEAYKAARIAVIINDEVQYVWGAGQTNLGVKGAGTIANCYATSHELLGDVDGLTDDLGDCYFKLPATQGGEPVVTTITIRAWIEGQDTECVNKNANDSFAIDIDLVVGDAPATQG